MNLKSIFYHNTSANSDFIKTHNNYISFVKDILSYSFSTNSFIAIPSQNELMPLNAINKVIRILALDVQNHVLQHTICDNRDFEKDSIIFYDFPTCPKCGRLKNCHLLSSTPTNPISFNISHHPTISFPWNKRRLIDAFGRIGTSVDNPFLFDKSNHFASLYAPINLLIIHNGFHSSTCGIYDVNAIYYPQTIYDLTHFYEEIYFDGNSFRHKTCNCIIETPENKSLGTIFEIGRLLYERNLSLLTLLDQD